MQGINPDASRAWLPTHTPSAAATAGKNRAAPGADKRFVFLRGGRRVGDANRRAGQFVSLKPTGGPPSAFDREQQQLAGHTVDGVIAAGVSLPDAELLDVHGSTTLLAVSPQKPDGSLTMQQKNELTFTVVSDTGNTLATAAGILTGPSEEARAQQLELGLDLTAVNADGTITLPMPTTLIVDADDTLRWIDVHPDHSTRTEPADILAALDSLAN